MTGHIATASASLPPNATGTTPTTCLATRTVVCGWPNGGLEEKPERALPVF